MLIISIICQLKYTIPDIWICTTKCYCTSSYKSGNCCVKRNCHTAINLGCVSNYCQGQLTIISDYPCINYFHLSANTPSLKPLPVLLHVKNVCTIILEKHCMPTTMYPKLSSLNQLLPFFLVL